MAAALSCVAILSICTLLPNIIYMSELHAIKDTYPGVQAHQPPVTLPHQIDNGQWHGKDNIPQNQCAQFA
jgi:hypothetical protein